jgi:hypothetical protein
MQVMEPNKKPATHFGYDFATKFLHYFRNKKAVD